MADLKKIFGKNVSATTATRKSASPKGETKTIEDVRNTIAENLLKQIQKAKIEDTKRAWFFEDAKGDWYIKLKYGTRAIVIDGAQDIGPFQSEDVFKALTRVRKAVLDGDLDTEVKKAWSEANKAGKIAAGKRKTNKEKE